MQFSYKVLFLTFSLLFTNILQAEDYIQVNQLQYNESGNRIKVLTPSVEVNKDLGLNYTLNTKFTSDTVRGGIPTFVDTNSNQSNGRANGALSSNIKKENVDMQEQRSSVSISLEKRLENSDEITTAFTKSYKSDNDSNTLSISYLNWADEVKNRSYDMELKYQLNKILIQNCTNNAQCSNSDVIEARSSKEISTMINTKIGVTQVIDSDAVVKASLFYTNKNGYLSNQYFNVVRNNNGITADVVAEKRPNKRVAYGFGVNYLRAFSDILNSEFKYKFYTDDWGIHAHTIDINNYYKFDSKYTIGFGLRYYTQSKADFYNSSSSYFTNQKFASQDDQLSRFNAITYKATLDYKYNDKVSYGIGLNLYKESTGLNTSYLTVGFKYKF